MKSTFLIYTTAPFWLSLFNTVAANIFCWAVGEIRHSKMLKFEKPFSAVKIMCWLTVTQGLKEQKFSSTVAFFLVLTGFFFFSALWAILCNLFTGQTVSGKLFFACQVSILDPGEVIEGHSTFIHILHYSAYSTYQQMSTLWSSVNLQWVRHYNDISSTPHNIAHQNY